MSASLLDYKACHREVAEALAAIGNPTFGSAIQQDRGSQLAHLGIAFPALRQRVRQGFSFTQLPALEALHVWDSLWRTSPYADVLFAALAWCEPLLRKAAPLEMWSVLRHWGHRVDNWCHSDELSALYSCFLALHPGEVYPQLEAWNRDENQWLRRISLVTLIHYKGKKTALLPPEQLFPLITTCLDDQRHHVQLAVGWVLRDIGGIYSDQTTRYLETHAAHIGTAAFSRATERHSAEERARLRELRKRLRG